MAYWWEDSKDERYWCEITDRHDIGADLKCPQTDGEGRSYWSYSLIRSVWPADVVIHYSTRSRAFVGASVAGGPLEERPITWVAHGTVGRQKDRIDRDSGRAGWWLPLHSFRAVAGTLPLKDLQAPEEQAWIRSWIEQKQRDGAATAPFQLYPGQLRASQGYLTKMPLEFVNRWPALRATVDALAVAQERVSAVVRVVPPAILLGGEFRPKSDASYVAFVRGGMQRRTRLHEALVRDAGLFLLKGGARVSSPHPMDLMLESPRMVILEAKIVGERNAGFAVRDAIGQLFEYRHFLGPRDAELGILLDQAPDREVVSFVEDGVGLLILWLDGGRILGGPKTSTVLASAGIAARADPSLPT
jgi:hypothetical protein